MEAEPHILIVDDEPNVRKVLGTLLEQAGFVENRRFPGWVDWDNGDVLVYRKQ